MLLDSFKLNRLIVQVNYPEAWELWDSAGRINRKLDTIWPGLSTNEVQPNQQVMESNDVQIMTGLAQSTVSCNKLTTVDQHTIQRITQSFNVWRTGMELGELTRVSTRAIYSKKFATYGAANAELLGWGLVKLPKEKVFDQSQLSPKNAIDLAYRFEDEEGFSILRVRTEHRKIEIKIRQIPDAEDVKDESFHLVIDFDRGVTSELRAVDFRMDEWLKGFIHVLRRDVSKVLEDND